MKKQLNEFVQRSIKFFNNRYDYVEVNSRFEHMYSRIPVLCPSHGRFWVVAKAHLKGQGCEKCKIKAETQATQRRETTLLAREKAIERILPGARKHEQITESKATEENMLGQ